MAAFIGREQDLETVNGYLQAALQGKGSVVFITGEAGIGKTTFIKEFKTRCIDAHNAAAQGKKKQSPEIRFAEAKCSELIGKGESYAPFIEIIGRFVTDDKAFGSSKLAEVVRDVGADWFELVPVIGKALKLVSKTFFKWQSTDDVREIAERTGKKEKLVQQYVQMLKLMSEKHPLVLFVDDLHWADDSSIYLLFQLAREIQDRRILILGAYRPTDIQAARGDNPLPHPLKDALSEMHRYGICNEIKLGYLTPEHIRRYLDAIFPQNRLDAAFVAYLHDLTEGNPFFVTEQVKLLQAIGKIAEVNGAWQLRGTLRDADMPIPAGVEKTIEKRFERLKEDLQETLQYASVNGEQFDSAVLAQMLQQDELAVLKQLQTLDRVYEFVREQKPDARPTTRGSIYQFIHSLVQKALYGTLSEGIKRKLHAKAAEIIESLYAEQHEAFAEELAAHWERGREYANAAPYVLLAARKANRQSGYQEARNHAQHGLDLLKLTSAKTPDPVMLRLQIELLTELATAEEAIGEAKNSIDHAETAAKLVEMVDDQSFQGEIFYQVGNLLLLSRTNHERVLRYLEKSLALKIKTKEYEFCINTLETMLGPCRELGKEAYLIEHCQEIIRLNQQEQNIFLNITIFRLMSEIFYHIGKYQDAYYNATEGFNIAIKLKDPYLQIELLQPLVEYAVKSNNFSKALEHYAYTKNLACDITDPEIRDSIFYKLGCSAWYINKFEEALEYFRIAKEAAHNREDLQRETQILSVLTERYSHLKKFEEAIQYSTNQLQISQKLGRVNETIRAFSDLGSLFRYQGDHAKALEMRQKALELSRKYGREISVATYLGTCHMELRLMGKFQEAIESIREAIKLCQETKGGIWELDCLTNLAVCYLSIGYIKESEATINQALILNQTIHNKNSSIILSLRHSYLLIVTGHYKEANTMLENSIEELMRIKSWGGDTPIHLINSIQLHLAFDMVEKAVERLNQVEGYFKPRAFLEATAMLKDAYAQVYLAQGDLVKATASVNAAIALFQQMNSYRLGEAYLTLAAIELSQQPAAALQHALDAGNIFKPIEYYRCGETVLMAARAHFALENYTEMQAQLKIAAAEFKRLQQPHHLAEVKLLYGQYLLAAGQHAKALQMLTNAKNTFVKLGLKRLEREAQCLINTP